jgi:hypothetical protein
MTQADSGWSAFRQSCREKGEGRSGLLPPLWKIYPSLEGYLDRCISSNYICSLSRLCNYLFAVLIDNGQGSPSRCVNYSGYVVLLLKWIPDIDPPVDPSKRKD